MTLSDPAARALDFRLMGDLLALGSPEEQTARLYDEGLLNEEGLIALLDVAERLVGADPDQARALVLVCERACATSRAPAVGARAAYLLAQTHAIAGSFDDAAHLIEVARSRYEQLGMTLEALRTTVGLMRVLGETGRYAEALDAGHAALARLDAAGHDSGEAAARGAVAARLLQNCGFCYEQIGRYDEALSAYAAAEERYEALGLAQQRAHIIENRGAVLMALGHVQEALAAYAYAEEIYAADALEFYQAQTLINIGEAHLQLGNYMPSLRAFEQAARLFDGLGHAVDRHILLRHMGDAYLMLNLHAEALDAYNQARRGLQAAGLTLHYALTMWGLAVVQIARNRMAEAAQALEEAVLIVRGLDNVPLLSALLLEQSRVLEVTDGPQAARGLARQALDLVASNNWTVQAIYANLRNADLCLPDAGAAERFLGSAQTLMDTVELPHLRYRLEQRWGHLRLLQNDRAAALDHLRSAIERIERLRSTLVQERLRSAFLDDKTTAYQDLVRLYLEQGDGEGRRAAFSTTEMAKSRALTDLMAGAVPRALDAPAHAESDAPLQSLQTELNAIYNEMLTGGDGESDDAHMPATAALKARAAEIEQAISHLRLRRSIEQGERPVVSAQGMPEARPELPADAAMLAYHTLGDEIVVFVWVRGELHVCRDLSTAGQVQRWLQRLAAQWARMRTGDPALNQHARMLELAAQRLLQQLYDALVAPALPLLDDGGPADAVQNLVIVPHGLLHQVPFQALHDGHHYLIERFAVSYAPSAGVFNLCRQRTLRRGGAALALAASDAQIPAAAGEARRAAECLRERFADVHLLLEEQATLAAFTDLAARCTCLHVACHGIFRGDNPLFSALKLYDGWLTAAQAAQLDLNGALVVLSACETGRSQVEGGDEILGLVYGFLGAGAATLLVSQWLVQDEVTAQLMARWYGELTTANDLAAALRAAQLATMANHPHPYYWAPFVLVGQRAAD